MPLPTPFHPRTQLLNQAQEWRDWSGYLAAAVYEMYHEREYFAVRNAAALIDISPLYKYEVTGPEALRLVNRLMTRDLDACRIGQVMYSPWCDDDGKVIDDGTIARLGENHFRITSADPNLRWFQACGMGMQAEVKDVSTGLAALALQGPNSRPILEALFPGAGLADLRYFRLTQTILDGFPLTVTRTGYTGDLGYELWVEPEGALNVWDRLMETGAGYGIMPAGLVALDLARIEAGLLLIDVDYFSAPKTFIPAQKSSPFEIGLGWTVPLEKEGFVGREALLAEKARPPRWAFAGLEIDWVSLEEIFGEVDLPPQVTGRASRASLPVYAGDRQVGYATSHAFSPLLKKTIALATLEAPFSGIGTRLDMEFTVEHRRRRARARVVKTPFYEPEWKRN